jgi:hypothetical protein
MTFTFQSIVGEPRVAADRSGSPSVRGEPEDQQEDDMLASTVIPDTNIVAITYSAPARAEEMLDAREEVDGVVRRCGRARLLVEYGDVDHTRVEPKAMWVSLRTARLLGDVDKVAVITDAGWIDKLTEIAGPVTDVEVESFVNARRDEAVAWLHD